MTVDPHSSCSGGNATPRFGRPAICSATAGGIAVVGVLLLLQAFPDLELAFLAQGAARLAGIFTGSPVFRTEHGWALPATSVPVVVTSACSATGFLVLVAALVAGQLARRGRSVGAAVLAGWVAAPPVAVFVNALRLVTVVQVHRWVGSYLPENYDAFTHLLAGVAVFLPALVALNLLLEFRECRPAPPADS